MRANPLCHACKRRDVLSPSSYVDHIIPLAFGGADSEANYQALCERCHARKSGIEGRIAQVERLTLKDARDLALWGLPDSVVCITQDVIRSQSCGAIVD